MTNQSTQPVTNPQAVPHEQREAVPDPAPGIPNAAAPNTHEAGDPMKGKPEREPEGDGKQHGLLGDTVGNLSLAKEIIEFLRNFNMQDVRDTIEKIKELIALLKDLYAEIVAVFKGEESPSQQLKNKGLEAASTLSSAASAVAGVASM